MDSNPLLQILNWFKDAIPQPTERTLLTQMGVHFEEVNEMIDAINPALSQNFLKNFSNQLKEGKFDLSTVNDIELLDAICDQIVTALGVAYMKGFDIKGALTEVANSNDSKRNADGSFSFDSNGKIVKGINYKKPDLTTFINNYINK